MKRKKMLLILSIMLVLTIVVGISYSFFSARITKINETKTDLKANELGLIYTGLGEIDYESMIPGDSFEKTFQVENISNRTVSYNIYMENITNELNEDLVYVLYETNSSGEVIKTVKRETPLPVTGNSKSYLLKNIEIEHDSFKYYKLTIEYKYQETSQNAYQGARFIATLGIDSNPIRDTICKRVENEEDLHTETCRQSSGYCGSTRGNGATITYGRAKEIGTPLETGDAFDCDVLGDGSFEYEGQPARFYYVSTMANADSSMTDNSIGVLIYYTSVVGGHNSTASGAYWANNTDTNTPKLNNTKGPIAAIRELPSADTWSGVSLKNTRRLITYEASTVILSPYYFEYGDVSSRLLTFQEVYNGCYNGSIYITNNNSLYSKCEFLLENTSYSISSNRLDSVWLETPYYSDYTKVYTIYSYGTRLEGDIVGVKNLAKPAIEVPLSKILY